MDLCDPGSHDNRFPPLSCERRVTSIRDRRARELEANHHHPGTRSPAPSGATRERLGKTHLLLPKRPHYPPPPPRSLPTPARIPGERKILQHADCPTSPLHTGSRTQPIRRSLDVPWPPSSIPNACGRSHSLKPIHLQLRGRVCGYRPRRGRGRGRGGDGTLASLKACYATCIPKNEPRTPLQTTYSPHVGLPTPERRIRRRIKYLESYCDQEEVGISPVSSVGREKRVTPSDFGGPELLHPSSPRGPTATCRPRSSCSKVWEEAEKGLPPKARSQKAPRTISQHLQSDDIGSLSEGGRRWWSE